MLYEVITCMAVSGKCYLSLHENNASANRGACMQTCRKGYEVTELESVITSYSIHYTKLYDISVFFHSFAFKLLIGI